MEYLPFTATSLTDGFWKHYYDVAKTVTVYSVYDRFKETGRFDALSCRYRQGQENKPHIYWDSDVAKWIEGVAYLLARERDADLEQKIDDMVAQIAKNQREDGYFNSYFLGIAPSEIYSNRDFHELYCTGHLIEAALAYEQATGKDLLLRCMLKNVDYIYRIFVEEQSAAFVTPGHEEIELALLKLYRRTTDPKHLSLARFFMDQRGNNDKEEGVPYNQSDLPLREISEAKGHAVRACYLYTAMAMMAKADEDVALLASCNRVFEDIIQKKMSITGGIGSQPIGEKFSYAYDLPNRGTYNETCAAISLAMFASEMQLIKADSLYGDLIERIYYNGFLSGMSLGGDHFFYTNPMELDLDKYQRDEEPGIRTERVRVFDCSCCPPNILRMLASLPRYAYAIDGNVVYCHQFVSGQTRFMMNGREAVLTQKTAYPHDGNIQFSYSGDPMTLRVRIPSWCVEFEGETHNGFAEFRLNDGDSVTVTLPMEVHFMEANPEVQDNAGRYAVMRGPIVYCMEGIDNGRMLRDITLLDDGTASVAMEDGILAPILYMNGERRVKRVSLYHLKSGDHYCVKVRLIPYFAIANRGATDMVVWTMVK